LEGWFRLLAGEPLDAHALLLASDAFPPTAFAAGLPIGWTPTIELTVHVRDPHVQGWIRCEFRSRFVSGGYIEEDGLFWDESGQLVAQSRQLAMVSRG
ncbi:MAG: thioesterase family protein, partial [Armatimonadetes bacterium]